MLLWLGFPKRLMCLRLGSWKLWHHDLISSWLNKLLEAEKTVSCGAWWEDKICLVPTSASLFFLLPAHHKLGRFALPQPPHHRVLCRSTLAHKQQSKWPWVEISQSMSQKLFSWTFWHSNEKLIDVSLLISLKNKITHTLGASLVSVTCSEE